MNPIDFSIGGLVFAIAIFKERASDSKTESQNTPWSFDSAILSGLNPPLSSVWPTSDLGGKRPVVFILAST
jgi:hypothetical protein